MDDLNKYYKNSLLNNLCSEYRGYWQSAHNDKEKLMKLALSQQAIPHLATYCHNGQGVSKDYILENFKDYINGNATIKDADGVDGFNYELYVAFDGFLSVSADVTNIMWCNNLSVELPTSKCPILYISNDSDIYLNLDGFNSVKIYLFDNSRLTIESADETCDITVYKYSNDCKVERGKFCLCERIKEHRKELRL